MSKLVVSTCPVCNKEFSYYPSGYKNGVKIHCSRKCQKEASRIWTNCPQCGKEFWYHKSWPRIYCSRECSATVNIHRQLGVVEIGPMLCEQCGKEITGQKWTGRRFCSRDCFGKHLSETRKGIPRPDLKGERPDLQKRVIISCIQCGKEFEVKQSHAERRRCCSKECLNRWQSESGIYSGPRNFNWKGGYDPYYGPNWRKQRRKVHKRDNHTCQVCGITEDELGRQMDVHHITPFREFGVENYKEANKLSNLISLCYICHLEAEHDEFFSKANEKAPY